MEVEAVEVDLEVNFKRETLGEEARVSKEAGFLYSNSGKPQ